MYKIISESLKLKASERIKNTALQEFMAHQWEEIIAKDNTLEEQVKEIWSQWHESIEL